MAYLLSTLCCCCLLMVIDRLLELDVDASHFNALYPNLRSDDHSKYYSIDDFNATFSLNSSDFNLLHLNIRSIYPKLDLFKTTLSSFRISFDVVVLSETWLNLSSVNLLDFPGYRIFHSLRSDNRRGGGVSILVNHKFCATKIDRISLNCDFLESLALELVVGCHRMIVVAIYRPPNTNIADFLEKLDEFVSVLGSMNVTYKLLCGDFNLDILNMENDYSTQQFVDNLFSASFIPLITRPTRITDDTFSAIDNIFTSNPTNAISGIIPCDLSDHYMIFLNYTNFCLSQSHPQTQSISYRLINDITISNLYDVVRDLDFSFVTNSNNVDQGISDFIQKLYCLFNECCPVKTKSVSYKNLIKPWIDRDVKRKIKLRQNYHILYKQGKMSREYYTRYRNDVTSEIKRKRKEYFASEFNSRRDNIRDTWNLINSIIKPNCNKIKDNLKININGTYVTDSKVIATEFNKYFSTVGENICNSFHGTDFNSYRKYLPDSLPNSLFLNPVSSSEIRGFIMSLKNKKCNIDTIPVSVLKSLSTIISPIISKLINKSFSVGSFPGCLKVAHISPIYKSDDSSNFSNYRPISVLDNISKIYEKVFYSRLNDFLISNNVLNDVQFGFRKNWNTSHAVVNLLNNVYSDLDEGKLVFTMFLDFKKAFDCVSHNILLSKLYNYGVRGLAYNWVESYLKDRKQCTIVNGARSDYCYVRYGVPQGSVLGPLLFLIFINDLPNCSNYFKFNLFADDTVITHSFSRNILCKIHLEINSHLLHLSSWLKSNKIKLNVDKTKYLIFSYRDYFELENILIDNKPISCVSSYKYLGCILDNNLTFKNHISNVSNKISKSLGVLYNIKNVLPQSIIRMLYFAMVQPYLIYCIIVWGNSSSCYLNSLLLLQKRAVRYITNSHYLAHTSELFAELRILKIKELFYYSLAVHFYKTLNIPHFNQDLLDYILTNTNNHHHSTRTVSAITLPLFKCEKTKCSIKFIGCKYWNYLGIDLKQITNLKSFNINLKSQILDGSLPFR